jgi:hypothetical protein
MNELPDGCAFRLRSEAVFLPDLGSGFPTNAGVAPSSTLKSSSRETTGRCGLSQRDEMELSSSYDQSSLFGCEP